MRSDAANSVICTRENGSPGKTGDSTTTAERTTTSSEPGRLVTIPDARKHSDQKRRYQLHLWISAKEYAMLKELAELHDEPMSRIVRRLFLQLKHSHERKVG